MYCTIDKEL